MKDERALIRFALLAAAIGAAFALATAIATVGLGGSYRPHASGLDLTLLPSEFREAERWNDWQSYSSIGFLVAAAITLLVVGLLRKTGLRSRVAFASAAIAVAMAVIVLWTRPLVQWDQLALWAVTTGTNAYGYWYASFNDGVRFVLIDGAEVSQTRYATAVIAHVAAPFLGFAALAMVVVAVIRAKRPDETTSS